jgi:hypothetical protein
MRRRALAAAIAAVCAAGLTVSATGVLGSRDRPPTAARAHWVEAARGAAGVFTLRVGALTRLDVQAPPGRLMISAPPSGPVANAVTVGSSRVWIARGSQLLGYTTDESSRTPVWATAPHLGPGRLLVTVAGPWMWAVVAGGRAVRPIEVAEPVAVGSVVPAPRAKVGALVPVPDPIVGIAAMPGGVWVLMRTPGGGAEIAKIRVAGPKTHAQVITRTARTPFGISSSGGLLCVLVRGQILRINPFRARMIAIYRVPTAVRTISVARGHVVATVPRRGEVIDIKMSRDSTRTVVMVPAPVRALVALPGRFWASIGATATPRAFPSYPVAGG